MLAEGISKSYRACRRVFGYSAEWPPRLTIEFLNRDLGEKTYLSRGSSFVRQRVQQLVLSSIGWQSVVWQRSKGFFQLLLERRRVLART